MALTRKFLKAMGIEDEKIDQIIEAHTETVSGLKDSLDKAEAAAKDFPAVQKELDAAKADLEAVKKDGWKDRHDALQKEHNALKKEFESYKSDVSAKEAKSAKEAAARAYYESKGITGKALDIAMRGSGAEIESLELEGGKIKDAAALEALVKGDFSGLVSTTTTTGANTATPPANIDGHKMTKDEIMNIKDAGERQRAIAENPTLFGI